ncbi:MAG: hypothetical protein EP330_24360 [Deltaproteobacteria bacterium]|nr:MAG: hypothetical protein EP330_24360 [Deltaproteobacteria bacterium]
MARQGVVSLDALRARIRELEGNQVRTTRSQTGVPEIDELVDGLPAPGIVEICGEVGSGRTRLALNLARMAMARGEPVAWVDFERQLYAPGVAAMGVPLHRLLVLRPPADRALWGAEQLIRSGCFPWVIAADPPPLRRAGQRWQRAAEAGRCTVIVLRQRPHRDLPCSVRFAVAEQRLLVVRDSGHRTGQGGPLPTWTYSPWA